MNLINLKVALYKIRCSGKSDCTYNELFVNL